MRVARELVVPQLVGEVVARDLERLDPVRPWLVPVVLVPRGKRDLAPQLVVFGPAAGPQHAALIRALRANEPAAVHEELVALRLAPPHCVIVQQQAVPSPVRRHLVRRPEPRRPAADHDHVERLACIVHVRERAGELAVAHCVRGLHHVEHVAVRARVVPDAAWPLPREGDLGAGTTGLYGRRYEWPNECGLRRRARAQQRSTDA